MRTTTTANITKITVKEVDGAKDRYLEVHPNHGTDQIQKRMKE